MLSLLPRWLKPERISIVCIAVMLVTTGCAGGSASQTRTGSRQVQATFSEFFIPTPGAEPADITQGPGETLWFTEELGNKIGRITPRGDFTEYLLPTTSAFPLGITLGPDAALWFVYRESREQNWADYFRWQNYGVPDLNAWLRAGEY